jgi:hypothetical protein
LAVCVRRCIVALWFVAAIVVGALCPCCCAYSGTAVCLHNVDGCPRLFSHTCCAELVKWGVLLVVSTVAHVSTAQQLHAQGGASLSNFDKERWESHCSEHVLQAQPCHNHEQANTLPQHRSIHTSPLAGPCCGRGCNNTPSQAAHRRSRAHTTHSTSGWFGSSCAPLPAFHAGRATAAAAAAACLAP